MPLLIATLEGDAVEIEESAALLGRSWLRRAAHAVASAGRSTASAVSNVAQAATHEAAQGARVTGRVARRGTATAAHDVAQGARVAGRVTRRTAQTIGHGIAQAGRVAERMAKRLIRSTLRPLLHKALGSDDALAMLGGDTSGQAAAKLLRQKKAAFIATVTPTVTAAVAAGTVTAPAAPAVPVLLPPILDELIDEVARKGKEILLGPDKTPDGSATGTAAASATGSGKIFGLPSGAVILGGAVVLYLLTSRKAT